MEAVKDPGSEREERFTKMVDAYQGLLLRMCYVYLRNTEEAKDAVQETFLKAYRALPAFRGECAEKTWLIRIALNTCKSIKRSAWMRHHDRYVTPEDMSGSVAEAQEDTGVLDQIMLLSPKYKEIIMLYYWQDMPVQEIGRLLSVTALAAGIILSNMTKKTAEMDAAGQLTKWQLPEKQLFIQAMRDSGYEMNETDWSALGNESLPLAEREAAADRIVYARFGAVQEESSALWAEPMDSVMGLAPDAIAIFRERYLAENPQGDEHDYLDALGYWLRDEYMPAYQAALPAAEEAKPNTALTQAEAEEYLHGYLTEVLGWSEAKAKQAVIAAEQDEASGAWHVSVQEDAVSLWVARADNGDWFSRKSLDVLSRDLAEANRQSRLMQHSEDEMMERALEAIMDAYGLGEEEIKRYFLYSGDWYRNDPSCIRIAYLLRTRNNHGAPWAYAAIVNMTTGAVDDLLTPETLLERLPLLAEAWDRLQENEAYLDYLRMYTTYSPYEDFGAWPPEAQAVASELFWTQGEK